MTDLVLPGVSAPRRQRLLSMVGLVAVVASALVGGNFAGLRETLWGSESPEARPAAASRDAADQASGIPAATTEVPRDATVLRSQPWWQGVTKLEGRGSTTATPFTVSSDALQWRAKWTCETGRLVVRAPGQARPVIDAGCPGAETGYSVRKGSLALQVTADGPWTLTVDQQVDLPLNEPPLPAMSAPDTKLIFTGSLYRMDQVGTGTLNVYQTADGRHLLRLDEFFVTANIDLELRFSPLEAPQTTAQLMGTPSVYAAPLDVTTGSLNFTVPPEVNPARFKSVVVWCPIIDSAYAAATLRQP
jgi:hypothetical protein